VGAILDAWSPRVLSVLRIDGSRDGAPRSQPWLRGLDMLNTTRRPKRTGSTWS